VKGLEEDKQGKLGVRDSLLETSNGASTFLQADSVAFHSIVGELSLLRGEPSGREWVIWQEKDRRDGNCHSHDTFVCQRHRGSTLGTHQG
jgi:hypothetical protein